MLDLLIILLFMRGCALVRSGACVWVCMGMGGCVRVCTCVSDEFSEFLPENRVPTSADFNTYPIRIFLEFLLLS